MMYYLIEYYDFSQTSEVSFSVFTYTIVSDGLFFAHQNKFQLPTAPTPRICVTGKLRNQAFREMPKKFSHFL